MKIILKKNYDKDEDVGVDIIIIMVEVIVR
jgi:hypothetical protein